TCSPAECRHGRPRAPPGRPAALKSSPCGRIHPMKTEDLIAIDVHTHAEISCRQPEDDYAQEIEEQKKKYFKSGNPPTIQETVEYYRSQKIGLVMFTVDTEFEIGRRRIPNEEVLDAADRKSVV